MKNNTLTLSLFSSLAVHGAFLLLASIGMRHDHRYRADLISVRLLELSRPVKDAPAPPQAKTTPPPRAEKPAPKSERKKVEPAAPAPRAADEAATSAAEAKPQMTKTETVAPAASSTRPDGGGSEAGAGSSFSNSEVEIATGSGSGIGGCGKALAGPGRGSGAPGIAVRSAPIRTNREAKPVQMVRASYPPMALRMGMESDVVLKIEVDTEGRVTSAEITKSGGAGFDEEALRAVKLARFEPAQKDGQTVPAEFTYIYRFRLQR